MISQSVVQRILLTTLLVTTAHCCQDSADQVASDNCGLPGKLANFQGPSVPCSHQHCHPGLSWRVRCAFVSYVFHLVVPFAGYFECDASVVVGRPTRVQELQAQVQQYDRVKAVGVGHSWWQQQFCSGSDASAVNIALTQLNNTLAE